VAAVPQLIELVGDPNQPEIIRWRVLWMMRFHQNDLLKYDRLITVMGKVLTEPGLSGTKDNKSNKMLRYDCMLLLCFLKGSQAPEAVLPVLEELLFDENFRVFVGEESIAGHTKDTMKKTSDEDGRILAILALQRLGYKRAVGNAQIMNQLRKMAADDSMFEAKIHQEARKLVSDWDAAQRQTPEVQVILDREEQLTDKDEVYKPNHKGDKFLGYVAQTGVPYKVYKIKLKKSEQIIIRMKSKVLDSLVVVEDSKKNALAFNDDDPDGGGTLDSKLVWIAPADGEYRIIATCLIGPATNTKFGDFHLTVERSVAEAPPPKPTPPPKSKTLTGHEDQVSCLAVAPDGKLAISGSLDGNVRVWDLETGKEKYSFDQAIKPIFNVAFSKNSLRFLACDKGKVQPFKAPITGVRCLVFSGDGKRVLAGGDGGMVVLWDVASGQPMRQMIGHTKAVTAVAFSADGRWALSGSLDKTVRLWNVGTGKEILRFADHTDAVLAVAFTPDNQHALSGGADKTVRVWKLPAGK
jgi:WD40 repeat protein